MRHTSTFYALFAILLWASLATLGVKLAHIPPFLLTGLGLLIGSSVGFFWLILSGKGFGAWRLPLSTLLLGVVGLFGFHFLLFMALRFAPPVQANLINYLWPLAMVVLAPAVLPKVRLRIQHLIAAGLGFAAAALAILGQTGFHLELEAAHAKGYLLAVSSCLVWALYSLGTKRVHPFATSALGLFGLVSAALAFTCSYFLEPNAAQVLHSLGRTDWLYLAFIGLGALGGAFYAWDAALKSGDAQRIGLLAFLTPILSTMMLSLAQNQAPHWSTWIAAGLIVFACWLGSREGQSIPRSTPRSISPP